MVWAYGLMLVVVGAFAFGLYWTLLRPIALANRRLHEEVLHLQTFERVLNQYVKAVKAEAAKKAA